jgi:hypothetical protein
MQRPRRSLVAAAAALALAVAARTQCEPRFIYEPVWDSQGNAVAMQVFDPDGGGPAAPVLVVGGRLWAGHLQDAAVVAYGGTGWQPLGSAPSGLCWALTVHNGRLIAAIADANVFRIWSFDGAAWQTLGTVAGTRVYAMAVYNGNLVIAGAFAAVDGVAAQNIAQWNGASWSSFGSGVTGTVRALAVFSASLYVGGDLTNASGIPVSNLAVWNGAAWAAGASFNGTVRSLAVRLTMSATSTYLFVGGAFTSVGVIPAQRIARFNTVNGWSAVGAGLPGSACTALYVRSTGVSTFELVAAVLADTMPAHRFVGSTWTALGLASSSGSNDPAALAYFAGRYFLAYDYGRRIVRELNAGSWTPVHGFDGFDDVVAAAHTTATDVVIGGAFRTISGVAVNGIARGRPGAWAPLSTGVDGGVSAVTSLPNGDVIAAGGFTMAGGVAANNIARWDGSSWSPLGAGIEQGSIYALLTMPDGDVIAAGTFMRAGGQNVNRIARWDGSAWWPLGSGLDETVFALGFMPNRDLVVGGAFRNAGGVPAPWLAVWNGTNWSAFPTGPDGGVSSLALLRTGDILVGGFFARAGGVLSPHIARWTGAGWAAVPGYGSGLFNTVHLMVTLPDGDVFVTGAGVSAPVPFPTRFDGQGLVPVPVPGYRFWAAGWVPTGEVVLGGDFPGYLGRYASPCPAAAVSYGAGCAGSNGLNALVARELAFAGGAFWSEATGMPPAGWAVTAFGLAATSIPISAFLRQGLPGCNVLTTLELMFVLPLVPNAGRSHWRTTFPAQASLIGQTLYHQVIALEPDALGNLLRVTSTNGLRLVIGSF